MLTAAAGCAGWQPDLLGDDKPMPEGMSNVACINADFDRTGSDTRAGLQRCVLPTVALPECVQRVIQHRDGVEFVPCEP